MKQAALLLALLVTATPAFAQGKPNLLNPSGKPLLNSGKTPPTMSDEACRQLAEYQPDPNAHVAYESGIDVHGKPVAPADTSRSPVTAPRVIKFTIDADVAQYAGIPLPQGQNLTSIGTVEVDTKTGDADFNGMPIEGPTIAALKDICRHPGAAAAPPAAPPADAAPPPDVPGSYEDEDAPAEDDNHNQ